MQIQTVAGRYIALLKNPNGGGYIGRGRTHMAAMTDAVRKACTSGGHLCCVCMKPHRRTDGGSMCDHCDT